mgnify:CR=1 FL=1
MCEFIHFRLEEVKALIEEDTDLEERDAVGYTALSYAEFSGENEIAQVLFEQVQTRMLKMIIQMY